MHSGTLCWLGMSLLRLPYAPMIGVLVGITALIPIVGAAGLIVGASDRDGEPDAGADLRIFLLVLQQEGNLIYPRVVGSSVDRRPSGVAAVTVGGSLWGIAGMLFAVPVASCTLLRKRAPLPGGAGTAGARLRRRRRRKCD
ncbi:MAG: AI-2E family transporter [Ruthenibacterium lactatiformans]